MKLLLRWLKFKSIEIYIIFNETSVVSTNATGAEQRIETNNLYQI